MLSPQTAGSSPLTFRPLSHIPWIGMWWGLLIVGCFYLIQGIGIAIAQFVAGLGLGLVEGLGHEVRISFLDMQVWLLPASLVIGTVAGVLVCLKMTGSRSSAEEPLQWLYDLVWSSDRHFQIWNYVGLGLGIGFVFLVLTLYVAPPPEDLPQPLFEAMLASPFLLQLGWVCLIVAVFPIIEETLFRGVLYAGVTQSLGPRVAFALTTVVFVMVHMPKVLYYWPAAAAVGFIGAFTLWIRIQTSSLAPGIALHGAYNGVLVGAALLAEFILPIS